MKILQANKFFFRNGGSEVVMFQERDYLLANGHTVIDFSMRDDRNFPSEYEQYFVSSQQYSGSQSKFERLKSALSLIHSNEAVSCVDNLIDASNPDLMHCHNIYHQLSPSIINAAKRERIPVVLTLHDYKPVCPTYNRLRHGSPCSLCLDGHFAHVVTNRCANGSFGKSVLLYAEAVFQKAVKSYENVDAFIAPSLFMQEAISHRIPKERIHLLYNGVDTNSISDSHTDEGYALYLGRLSSEKGISTLLEAHSFCNGSWPLVIAGTGPLYDNFSSRYDKAKFVGHLSGLELQETIAKAAVIVVPSEWYENCPMSVLEAMAFGKPVLGSRIGGIPELILEGETGLLFEPGSVEELGKQLDTLMSNRELRRNMGKKARLRVEEKFSLERHNAGLMEIYQTLLLSR